MINDVTGIRCEVERLLSRYVSEGRFKDLWNDENPKVIDDGILDVLSWQKIEKSKRILWLLKEHNESAPCYGDAATSGVDRCRMRLFGDMYTDEDGGTVSQVGGKFKKSVNRFRTLKLIELASHAILSSELPSNIPRSVSDRAINTFRNLCVVEVGKTPGGRRTSDKRLRLLCQVWKDIVRQQIKNYNPGIVISAGPQMEYLYSENERGLLSHKPFNSSYVDRYDFDGRIWLRTYHPGYLKVNRLDWVQAIMKAIFPDCCEK